MAVSFEEAISQIKDGKKPVIAVDNTLGSYVDELDENVNSADFVQVLIRGLANSIKYRIIQQQYQGGKKVEENGRFVQNFDSLYNELDGVGRSEYASIKAAIEELDNDKEKGLGRPIIRTFVRRKSTKIFQLLSYGRQKRHHRWKKGKSNTPFSATVITRNVLHLSDRSFRFFVGILPISASKSNSIISYVLRSRLTSNPTRSLPTTTSAHRLPSVWAAMAPF